MPTSEVAGRYTLLGEIGRGGMGVVYAAREKGRERPVALKFFSREFSESALRHFEQEFRTLTELSHPGLTEVYDFGRAPWGEPERMVPFFTMELVEGESVDRELRRGPMTPAAVIADLAQVAQALAYLHARGIVHRDVKPSNLIAWTDPDGRRRVKLMDLGLASRPDESGAAGVVRGTVAYVSPEGARGDPVDPRSDLYSLGCVAFEMLTGRPPFPSPSALAVLRGHLEEEPLPPSALRREVPQALDGIVLKLLAKDPGLRPATADRLLELLNQAAGGTLAVAAPEVRRYRVLGAGFVGRTAELATLAAKRERVARGGGGAILVAGEAGSGKSRLLRAFQTRSQIDGFDAFVGRAGDTVDGGSALAGAVARALRARGPLSSGLVARHGAVLATLLPDDAGVAGSPETGGEDRYRLPAALEAVLVELAAAGPLVLGIEDLHAADLESCFLLRHLVRALAAPAAPRVLVVGTYRSDEVSRSSPLFELLAEGREDGSIEEIALAPLGVEEVRSMLRAMTGSEEIPAAFVARVHEETRGNPLHVTELVALLAEEGLIEPGGPGPLDPDVLSRVPVPNRVRALLERRLAHVPTDARRLIEAAAILGNLRLDGDALAGTTGLRWEAVARQLVELESAGLIVRTVDEGGEPVDRIAAPALYALAEAGMDPASRGAMHAGALAYLERRGRPRRYPGWAALAAHAEAAGQPGRAAEAYERAGDLARDGGGLVEAADLYGRAIDLLLKQGDGAGQVLCGLYEKRADAHGLSGDLSRACDDARFMLARAEKTRRDALKSRAHLALGRALAAGGQLESAQESLEVALAIAERSATPVLAASAECGLGRVASRLAAFEEGAAHFERAVAHARQAVRPDLEVEAWLGLGALRREQGGYSASLAAFREARARADARTLARVESEILEGEALAHEIEGRLSDALDAYESARERAEARGEVAAAAQATRRAGEIALRRGDFEGASSRFEAAVAVHRRLGDRDGVVEDLEDLAALHLRQARYDLAREEAEEALRLARRSARRERLATSLHLAGAVYLALGDLETAGDQLDEAQRVMREVRHPRWLAAFLVDLADWRRLTGDHDGARRNVQEAAFLARKIGDRRMESVALRVLGETHLDENDTDRATVACRKALQAVERAGWPREEAEARLLRARVELSRPGGDVVRAEMDALDAAKILRDLRDAAALWKAEHVSGRAAARLGRKDDAAERIARAQKWLEAVRSRLPARWRDGFAALPQHREVFDDAQRIRSAARHDAAEGEGSPAAGPDGGRLRAEVRALKRMLEINRTLNATRDPDRLLPAILDAALEVTGAERGFLLLADGEELQTAAARGPEGEALAGEALALSRSIALRTIDSGEPVLATDAEVDERFATSASIHDLGIRSVLCVPLKIQAATVGAVYLDSRLDRAVFSAPHLERAALLAEQAAIALDTARLVRRIDEQRAHLDRMNRELEKTAAAQRDALADAREMLISARSSLELRLKFEEMVGGSEAMQRVYHLVDRLAPKKLPVLVCGESGTGKELIARALHARSDRSGGPFFTVNCAALPENLLESELFGYRKGAFTGATRNKPGYFELAHGGTLFLDEIGEMGPAMQAKLLRVLQEGTVLPVGGESEITVDVRIVSATNRDLEGMIREGRFREDLFYRIHVARIDVPPLRERPEDIPLLADHFLARIAADEGTEPPSVEPAVLERWARHAWPGNVRELQHHVQRLTAFARGSALTLRDVERYGDLRAAPAAAAAPSPGGAAGEPEEVESLEELERKQIALALERAGGNKTRAAEILGINRVTLFRKLKRLSLEP